MVVPTELVGLMRQAYMAAEANDRERSLVALDRFAQVLSVQHYADNFEFVSMLASIGRVYTMLNEHAMAALNLADVCAFAERHFPNTSETSGDYRELSEALERLGDISGALQAMDRAAHHLERTPEWPRFEPDYMQRRKTLQAKLKPRRIPRS